MKKKKKKKKKRKKAILGKATGETGFLTRGLIMKKV